MSLAFREGDHEATVSGLVYLGITVVLDKKSGECSSFFGILSQHLQSAREFV